MKIAIALCVSLLAVSCAHPVQVRASGSAFGSRIDDGTDDLSGAGGSGRIEVAAFVDREETVVVGVRGTVGGRSYDADDITNSILPPGLAAGVSSEVRTTDATAEGVVRYYPPVRDGLVQPYLEFFLGAIFQELTVAVELGGLESGVDVNGTGVTGGAGLGLEIPITDGLDAFLGAELRGSVLDFDEFTSNIDFVDFGGVFGLSFEL